MKNYFRLVFEACEICKFFEFWSSCYEEGKYPDDIYLKNIAVDLTPASFKELLEWKNGMPLSGKKSSIMDRGIAYLQLLNQFKRGEIGKDKLPKITEGFVWQIFILNICKPEEYPLIDQHTFRAYVFITQNKVVEKPTQNVMKQEYDNYKAYVFALAHETGFNLRKIDKGLMAFGQFLNSQFFKLGIADASFT